MITVLFQFVIYVEIYVKMNCIILNSFPIMCFKGAPVLATFLCLTGSLLDQLSCIIFTCSTCTYSEIYVHVYISVCLSGLTLINNFGQITDLDNYLPVTCKATVD